VSTELSRRTVLRAGLAAGAVGAAGAAGLGPAGSAAAARVGPAGRGDAASGRGFALTHATVVDTTGGPSRPDQTVIVRGGRIATVGRSAEVPLPRDATVVDLTGKFVIPGLADMHVHSEDMEQIYPPLYVLNGVTTVREMSGYPFLGPWRDRADTGDLFGPRWSVASQIVDGNPSLWSGIPLPHFEVKDAAEARQAVRQAKADGADFIKVYTRLTRETFHAVLDEARRQHITVAGHCPDNVALTEAADAGLRSVEHVMSSWYATSSREAEIRRAIASMVIEPGDYNGWFHKSLPQDWTAAHSYDPRKADRVFARLVADDCRQVPTLTMHRVFGMPETADRTDERLKYLPAATLEYWQWGMQMYTDGRTPQESARERVLVEHRARFVGNLRRAGVPVMAGTEAGTPFCLPGFALHDELAELVGAGFTPMQALQAATVEPARFLGAQHTMGTVQPGRLADLVVLDADPLRDIRHTRRIHAVVTRGRLISADQRRTMLAAVEAAAQAFTPDPAATPTGCACTGAARPTPIAAGVRR